MGLEVPYCQNITSDTVTITHRNVSINIRCGFKQWRSKGHFRLTPSQMDEEKEITKIKCACKNVST